MHCVVCTHYNTLCTLYIVHYYTVHAVYTIHWVYTTLDVNYVHCIL